MRSIIFTIIATIFVPFFSIGQIEVKESPKTKVIGTVKNGVYTHAELTEITLNSDTAYGLMFSNQEYKTITDYQSLIFTGSETVGQLYKILKSFFTDEHKKDKDYKVDIKLGNNDVSLSNFRTLGTTSVFVWCKKGYFYLTERQVEKLFGKE